MTDSASTVIEYADNVLTNGQDIQKPKTNVAKGKRYGGRKKGTPNRNEQFLNDRLKKMYGKDFDPIIKAAEAALELHAVAMETRTAADLTAAVGAWDRIGAYCAPKLKAIEIQGSDKAVRQIRDVTINVVSAAPQESIEHAAQSLIKDIN